MDVVFGIDIIVVFFSAYYDENFRIVDKLSTIGCQYLRGWFILDVLAIMPFDMILIGSQENMSSADSNLHVNNMVRIAKFGRISKMIRLTRIMRFVKVLRK